MISRLSHVERLSSGPLVDERPPICSACGVTMVPAALSGRGSRNGDWVCLEWEETTWPDEI